MVKHFLKTLMIFSIMIVVGLGVAYLISSFGDTTEMEAQVSE